MTSQVSDTESNNSAVDGSPAGLPFSPPSREKLLNEISLVSKRIGLYDINLDSWFSEELKISDQSYDKSYELPDDVEKIYSELQKLSEENKKCNFQIPKIDAKDHKNLLKNYIIISNLTHDSQVKTTQNFLKSQKKGIFEYVRRKNDEVEPSGSKTQCWEEYHH